MLAFLLNTMCPWQGFGRKEELVALRELDTKFLALGSRKASSEGVIVRAFGRASASVTRGLVDLCASQGGP